MVRVSVEIRVSHDFEGAESVEKVHKDDLLNEYVRHMQDMITMQIPEASEESFMTYPTTTWKKLPDTLYRVKEPGQDTPFIFRKSRKPILMPTSEYATFYMHVQEFSMVPPMDITISNQETGIDLSAFMR